MVLTFGSQIIFLSSMLRLTCKLAPTVSRGAQDLVKDVDIPCVSDQFELREAVHLFDIKYRLKLQMKTPFIDSKYSLDTQHAGLENVRVMKGKQLRPVKAVEFVCSETSCRFTPALETIQLFTAFQLSPGIAEDYHQQLKTQFVNELARNGRFLWKRLTILFTQDATSDKSDWILDIQVPKVMLELSPDNYPFISKMPSSDAYLIIANDESNSIIEEFLQQSLASKQIDCTKTFLIFSDGNNVLQNDDLDLIRIEERYTWSPKTKAVNKPILHFHRHRLLSTMEASEMIGVYDGNVLEANQKRILFDQTFSYRNRPVKVSTFSVPPTTVKCKEDEDENCGRDPNLIRVMGKILQFQPIFSSSTQAGSKWGNKLDNGTWTGLIGQVSRGEASLGVANVFMTLHYIKQVEFSYPYDISCSTFLTPPPELWPQAYALIKPFDNSIWVATCFSLFFGGLLIQMVALCYHKIFGSRDRLRFFNEAMIYNAQSITGVRSGSDEKSSWPVRIYTSNWWLFCFLLGTVYRTGLISWLARSPVSMLPIDTITQLVRSDLVPYGFNTFVRDLAQYSSDPDTIELGRRQRLVPPNMTVQVLMGQENVNALYENKHFLKYLSATVSPSTMHNISVHSVDPRQRLHVMRECLRTFPVAIAMNSGAPFKSAMTQIIHQLNGAGIIDHWLDAVVNNDQVLLTKRSKKKKEPFSLYSLEGAFYLLLLCYCIDIVVFLAEILFHKMLCRPFGIYFFKRNN
ncbi:glutamate receptor ionotropic, kainate 1-like [Daphnia carinata]|uniref:glutamate receptor ionotropic, kainate 1-like n=1 Tax=Daphnia carinata TaxID=120202 RepID=UPI00257E4968|nr:glutamate receptor ionotropic, kainate 1-like [Daphnia carinata]